MELSLVTAPAAEPLSLVEVKDHLSVEDTDHDPLLAGFLVSVREGLDGWDGTMGRALMTQTWDMQIGAFARKIEIPLPPLQSITSVKYFDTSDVEQTVASTVYRVETAGGFIERIDGQSWPSDVRTQDLPITIQFVAGYGDFNDVPQPIRTAMLLLIDRLFNKRDTSEGYGKAADALLAPYNVPRI